jgi:hypothetical protein
MQEVYLAEQASIDYRQANTITVKYIIYALCKSSLCKFFQIMRFFQEIFHLLLSINYSHLQAYLMPFILHGHIFQIVQYSLINTT